MHLARFIQISDLHFGSADDGVIPFWRGGVYNRFRAHDTRAARRLAWFWHHRNMDLAAPPAAGTYLLVTGDLTSRGAEKEFDLAASYLSAKATVGTKRISRVPPGGTAIESTRSET